MSTGGLKCMVCSKMQIDPGDIVGGNESKFLRSSFSAKNSMRLGGGRGGWGGIKHNFEESRSGYLEKSKNTIALMSPEITPIAAEAKNMRQKFPIAVKNAVAPLPAPGLAKPNTVLKINSKYHH